MQEILQRKIEKESRKYANKGEEELKQKISNFLNTENSEDFGEKLQEFSEIFLPTYVRLKIVETQQKPQVDKDESYCRSSSTSRDRNTTRKL